MTDRAGTLLGGRRERLERLLSRKLSTPGDGPGAELTPEGRAHLRDHAQDLYWNELEWENITEEEAMEGGPLAEMAFPGFLAYVRGLLLTEVMPDALAPASPRPQVVEDILSFLAARIVELEDSLADPDHDEREGLQREMKLANRLVDLVLYRYHGLTGEDVERVEADGRTSS
jgi:hypothetical protein